MVTEREVGPTSEPTLRDLSEAMIAVYGTDYGVHSPTWIIAVHRCDAAGGDLSQGARAGGRRRRAHPFAGWRARPADRRAGCGQSGLEAGAGDQGDFAGGAARHLPRRAPSGRCPRAAQHDGVGGAAPRGRAHARRCATPSRNCWAWTSRAGAWPHRCAGLEIHYDLGEGHPLLGRRMPDLDLGRPTARCGSTRCCMRRGRCCSISASPGSLDITPWADRVQLVDASV